MTPFTPHELSPLELIDAGFEDCLVPVAPPNGKIAPEHAKSLGKIPAILTRDGLWRPADLRKFGKTSRERAKQWMDWDANVGIIAGLVAGLVILDNDQGQEFTEILWNALTALGIVEPLVRYVASPTHHRNAFFLRVVDSKGASSKVDNKDFTFFQGLIKGQLQVLAHDKQSVVWGSHAKGRYAWNQKFDLDEVPQLTETEFNAFLRKVFIDLDAKGWKQAASATVAPTLTHGALPTRGKATKGTFAEVSAALGRLPNEDKADKDKTAWDHFIDEYANFIKIPYAIWGALQGTPDEHKAENLWLEWADGREQIKQSAQSIWTSVCNQEPNSGILQLHGFHQQFVADTASKFPDDEGSKDKPPLKHTWLEIKDRYGFCVEQNKYLDFDTGKLYSRDSMDSAYANTIPALLKEQYGLSKQGKKIKQHGPLPHPKKFHDFFDQRPDKTLIQNIVYSPGEKQFARANPVDIWPTFNLWKAPPRTTFNVKENMVRPWLDHIEFVLGDLQERDLFLRWCAYLVQRPKQKPNWAWLLVSKPGFGKDLMCVPLCEAIGLENSATIGPDELEDNFNSYLQMKFILFDEAEQPAVARKNIASKLKLILATPPNFHRINEKYEKKYKSFNRCGMVIFSNSDNSMYLDEGQRRVHVIDRRGVPLKPKDYYDKFAEWIAKHTDLVAGFLHEYPLPTDIDNEMRGSAPPTLAAQALIHRNRNPLHVEIDEYIADAQSQPGQNSLVQAVDILQAVKPNLGHIRTSKQAIGAYLRDLEQQPNSGVKRARLDPKHPDYADQVRDGRHPNARLWCLTPKAPDGTNWSSWSDAELLNLYNHGHMPRRSAAKAPSKAQGLRLVSNNSNSNPPTEIV